MLELDLNYAYKGALSSLTSFQYPQPYVVDGCTVVLVNCAQSFPLGSTVI